MWGLPRAGAVAGRGLVRTGDAWATRFLYGVSSSHGPQRRVYGNRSRSSMASGLEMHGTTILCVRKNGKVVMMGDGQVSLGDMVMKPNATKVRKLAAGNVLAGFAGSTADALTLMERLESKLEEFEGQLQNACVALAKDWRTDKYLRRLEAVVLVADGKISLKVSGLGDVLAPEGGAIAVGSGQPYALAAARALMAQEELSAEEVAQRAMEIAAELCVYTNSNFTSHELDMMEEEESLEVATGESTGSSEGDAGKKNNKGEGEGEGEEAKEVPEGSGEVEDKDKGNADKTEDDPKK